MSNLIQTIARIYTKTIHLYANSFFNALPFILVLIGCEFLINKIVPLPPETEINVAYFVHIVAYTGLTAFFVSFMLILIDHKFNQQELAYSEVIRRGFKRCLPIILSDFIIVLPFFCLILLAQVDITQFLRNARPDFIFTLSMISLFVIPLAVACVFPIMFCVTGVLIANCGASAIEGLTQSWRLVLQRRLETIFVMLIFGGISIALAWLLHKLQLPLVSEFETLLLSSFYPSLMVVQHDYLTSNNA